MSDELRKAADAAEKERVEAHEADGYIAAPGTGDYHAEALAAKQGHRDPDPDRVKDDDASAHTKAAARRREAGTSRTEQPAQRRSRADEAQGKKG